MAIVQYIPESRQNPSAQKAVIDYCCQPYKTQPDEHTEYISGINCLPECANLSFLATQKVFGCEADGVRFYHYVQSFSPEENVSAEVVHEIGKELAKYFGNREIIVATHIDREHLHNHFVINSYDFETGRKLHMNKESLKELRDLSDEICKRYGLSVLPKYEPREKSINLGSREYHSAMKGQSWKMEICSAIDTCMEYSATKEEFIANMKSLGYGVIWTSSRKNITYTKGDKRVRDTRLHEEKYLKENMENEFTIRRGLLAEAQGKEHTEGAPNGTEPRENNNQARGDCGTSGSSNSKTGGSGRTGWESQRESFKINYKANHQGRNYVRGASNSHSTTNTVGASIVGLGRLAGLIENGEESEEEKKQREAQNTGAGVGLVIGAVVGAIIATDTDDGEDEAPIMKM